ncbi:MAG: alpha-ketoacid dehydrogenase subunit beta [Armatimonadetes bacterium]|nr:alpha-ketoacid dehydrogenase subunit beta [Armatimonadota bacterium]
MPILTYREALREALIEEMERDAGVFIIGEEVGEYQGTFRVTEGLRARFGPLRVADTPISEEAFTALAVGAAMAGLRPIVEYMTMNFCLRALDQIINHAAQMHYMSGNQFSISMVLRGPNGKGERLGSQHSHALETIFMHTPGLKIAVPATPADAKGLLKTAIRDPNPVVFLEHAALYTLRGEIPEGEHLVPFGQAAVRRPGAHCTVVSYSRMTQTCLRAAGTLARDGIEVEVIDLRTLAPLDTAALAASVARTHHTVVVSEARRTCSVAAEIASRLYESSFDDLDAPIEILAGADVPMPYSRELERLAVPDEAAIIGAVRRALWREGAPGIPAPEVTHAPVDHAEDGRRNGGRHHPQMAQERG